MGNTFGNLLSSEPEPKYPEVFNREGLVELRNMLGTVVSPVLENNPNPISNEEFNDDCALSNHLDEIWVNDPECLNQKLKYIADYIKAKFNDTGEETSVGGIYPEGDDDMNFKCGHLSMIKPNKEGNYMDFQTNELSKKFPESVGNIKKLFRGFSVYQFNDEVLTAVTRSSYEDIGNVLIGMHNNSFMLFNPDADMIISDCLKICWWGYLLEDNTFHIFPGTGGGVNLNEHGTVHTMDLSGLRELESWIENGNLECLAKFETWKKNVVDNEKVWCLVDGEQEGNLIDFESFLENIEIADEVFEPE